MAARVVAVRRKNHQGARLRLALSQPLPQTTDDGSNAYGASRWAKNTVFEAPTDKNSTNALPEMVRMHYGARCIRPPSLLPLTPLTKLLLNQIRTMKKSVKTIKKLSLNKETLVLLDGQQLQHAKGGRGQDPFGDLSLGDNCHTLLLCPPPVWEVTEEDTTGQLW